MTTDPAAFYTPVSEHEFDTTTATASPWDDTLQHGGPPAALLARAIEATRPDAAMPIARITVDMLGGIPQGRIRTEAEIVRPGKRVELVQARLWAQDKLAVTATAWRIRTRPGSTAQHVQEHQAPALPAAQPQIYFEGVGPDWGYGRAIDWRFVQGGYDRPGPAKVWARPRIPLVEGEEASPVGRLLVVADSVNGLSAQLPIGQWLSIPPTLNVTMQRPLEGAWVFLDTNTLIGPDGIGTARGQILDEHGFVAEVAQPLLVQARL